MERTCQVQLLAEAAGTVVPIEHQNAKLTHSQIGGEFAGWISFQPLFDQIVAAEPDLLD